MERISSFCADHTKIVPGIYKARIDGDITTYDMRTRKPNSGDYMDNSTMHTFEHLFATYARNSSYGTSVLYVGPMGCRTGFYLLLREDVSRKQALDLVKESFRFIAGFEGEIPGAKPRECGNYKEHDLPGAKSVAKDMLDVLKDWNEEKMQYAD